MADLLYSLKRADEVCKQANIYFEKISQGEKEIVKLEESKNDVKNTWILIAIVIGLILFFVSGIVFLACYLKYKKEIESINEKIKDINKQNELEFQKAQAVYEKNKEDLSFLPSDYWYPLATEYLVKAIESKRVNTLGEALDIFDTQLHRWKVEQANSEMLAQQQLQTKHLKSIRTSSAINAVANVTNATINIASKL